MKESYSEDIVSHTDSESCECVREGTFEALTGEPTGRAIEPRNQVILREADFLMVKGRQHRARRQDEAHMAPARSIEPGHEATLLTRKPGDLRVDPPQWRAEGPRVETQGNKHAMNEPEKSDNSIVSKKPANKVGRESSTAELVEKRGLAKGNLRQQTSDRTQSRKRLQRALARIREGVNEPRLRVTT